MSVASRVRTFWTSAGLRTVGNILLWGAVPLVLGWVLSLYLIPQPVVGTMTVYEVDFLSTLVYMEEIREARENPRIKAVVVQFSSPGGVSTQGQALYLELQHLRQQKPVVGSINDMAASAGYRLAVATEPIYAKPGSYIGNVGTWAYFPSDVPIDEDILASGPFKLSADNEAEFVHRIQETMNEFLATVVSQRGDRLKLTPAELSQGLLYSGNEAIRLGLIDHIGGQTEAIEAAAKQAGLANYRVVDLEGPAVEKIFGDPENPTSSIAAAWPSRVHSECQDAFECLVLGQFYSDPLTLLEIWPGALIPTLNRSDLLPDGHQIDEPQLEGTR